MLLAASTLDIRYEPEFDNHCLHFIFKGKFSKEDSVKGVDTWRHEFEKHDLVADWTIIWNCEEMTGFEMAARKEWYNYLKESNYRIGSVIVISKNIIIRGAARVMLEFFGIKSEIVRSFEDLHVHSH